MPTTRPACDRCTRQRREDEHTLKHGGTIEEVRAAGHRLADQPPRGQTVSVDDKATGERIWICPWCTPYGDKGLPLAWYLPNHRARRGLALNLPKGDHDGETDDGQEAPYERAAPA